MTRPCFLVIDREYAGSISTRKLVLETAKLNVITAYSGEEALATLERFPAIDGVVLDAGLVDIPSVAVIRGLKTLKADLPIVVIGTPLNRDCDGADEFLESFNPAKLLELLARIIPAVVRVQAEEDRRFLGPAT